MENLVTWLVTDYLPGLSDSFVDPKKRVSLVYLFSAIILALGWSFFVTKRNKKQAFQQVVKKLFSKRIWFSFSVRADLFMILINRAIILILSPILISKIALTTGIFYLLSDYFSSSHGAFSGSPYWVAPISYTLFLFIIDDFSRFFIHKAMHRIPILWAVHKVHHSAEYLTPFTVFRTHPLEGIIFILRSIVVVYFYFFRSHPCVVCGPSVGSDIN